MCRLSIHTCVPAQFNHQPLLFLIQRRTPGVCLECSICLDCGRGLGYLGGFGCLGLLCWFGCFWWFGFFGGLRCFWFLCWLGASLLLCFGFFLCCFLCSGFRERGWKHKNSYSCKHDMCVGRVCVIKQLFSIFNRAVWTFTAKCFSVVCLYVSVSMNTPTNNVIQNKLKLRHTLGP